MDFLYGFPVYFRLRLGQPGEDQGAFLLDVAIQGAVLQDVENICEMPMPV